MFLDETVSVAFYFLFQKFLGGYELIVHFLN